ncbi:molybdopterin synthase sulfur carrier subunit [Lysobacter maris]|uniref:Molybdopterin synthase sulfur carrier subunit n=1 Tax=Marilutibacter maris TaxID=1605891 RepID=A0A508A1R9_9GAMM|nr:MoaD/ThiS family protein [Lysobacter maris]KAB8172118.1 molybdopterin synthase sulfur carrier subunit [Lysobacter maris]
MRSVRLTVLYFASLREAAGRAEETVQTDAASLREVYEHLQACHGLPFPVERLRVAVDGAFARWEDAPQTGSEVAFIPPVSGG